MPFDCFNSEVNLNLNDHINAVPNTFNIGWRWKVDRSSLVPSALIYGYEVGAATKNIMKSSLGGDYSYLFRLFTII